MAQPLLYMIAGPNGAGKTTAAMSILPAFLSTNEFVNADEIARGLNPLNPYGQPMAAGRVMLERIGELIGEQKSFAFETTGASQSFTEKIQQAKAKGYGFGLIYLWLPSFEVAKERVRQRVAQGGHDVPASNIERRFTRSISNLVRLYLPLADKADIFDATTTRNPTWRVVAEKKDSEWHVYENNIWRCIERIAAGNDHE